MTRQARLAVVASALVLLIFAGPAFAASYRATNAASLQAAVAKADASSAPSTIELGAGSFQPTSTLAISQDVTIIGPSVAPGASLAGSAVEPFPSSLLRVEAHAKLTLWNVELGASGGQGAPTVDDLGDLDLESSTITASIGTGVLVEPRATATVTNSTLSGGLGFGLVDDGTASLVSSTVASNEGGGIENRGQLSLTNTIVAQNGRPGDCVGVATSSDHSLDSDGSCGVGALSRSDPRLGALAANGGPTETQALSPGSPAIDAGDDSRCPRDDQRHYTRAAGRCDIGAYQADAAAPGAPSSPSGTGSGSGHSPPASSLALVAVSGHGTLRGLRRSRITFNVRAEVGHASAKFIYTDRARRVELRALTMRSLVIEARRGVATLRGSSMEVSSKRRVSVTVVLVRRSVKGSLSLSLSVRLSSGYHESGRLLSGSISYTRRR